MGVGLNSLTSVCQGQCCRPAPSAGTRTRRTSPNTGARYFSTDHRRHCSVMTRSVGVGANAGVGEFLERSSNQVRLPLCSPGPLAHGTVHLKGGEFWSSLRAAARSTVSSAGALTLPPRLHLPCPPPPSSLLLCSRSTHFYSLLYFTVHGRVVRTARTHARALWTVTGRPPHPLLTLRGQGPGLDLASGLGVCKVNCERRSTGGGRAGGGGGGGGEEALGFSPLTPCCSLWVWSSGENPEDDGGQQAAGSEDRRGHPVRQPGSDQSTL